MRVEEKRRLVFVDLDHVVSDAAWRDHLIPVVRTENWDDYHCRLNEDRPCEDVINLVRALTAFGYNVFGLTARPGKWRQSTMEKLVEWDVPFVDVLMRPDDNYHPAGIMKVALVEETFGPEVYDVTALVIDDNDKVVEAFRGKGVTVLQCFGRDYRKSGVGREEVPSGDDRQ